MGVILRGLVCGMLALGMLTAAGEAAEPEPDLGAGVAEATESQPGGPGDSLTELTGRIHALENRVAELERSGQHGAGDELAPAERASRGTATGGDRANPLVGKWVNVEGRAGGVPKLDIAAVAGGWTIRGWGACEPTDCDWGATPLHLLGESVSSQTLPYGFAKWDPGFKDSYIVVRIEDGELIAELYSIYKDGSGRSNTRRVARFQRADAEKVDLTGAAESAGTSGHSIRAARDAQQVGSEKSSPAPMRLTARSLDKNLIEPLGAETANAMDDTTALYIAFGSVDAESTLVEANWDGTVRSCVDVPYSISGLAPDGDGLVATVGSSRVGEGRVISLTHDGQLTTLFRDAKLLPDTIAIWSTCDSGEILVADNGADVIVSVPKDGRPPVTLFRVEGHDDFQSMSVAKCLDGSLLYNGSDLRAVYRMRSGSGPMFRKPVLSGEGVLAADPKSEKWIAAVQDELHVFDGDREIARYPYPPGRSMWYPLAAFASRDQLVLGLAGENRTWFYAVDLKTGTFSGILSLNEQRVVSLAIAPKMDW